MTLLTLFTYGEAPTPLVPVNWPTGHRYEVYVTDHDGTRLGLLTTATVDSLEDKLNDVPTAKVRCSAWDPALFTVLDPSGRPIVIGRYLELVQDGALMRRVVIVDFDMTAQGEITLTCAGMLWWLTQRVNGAANRHDWLGFTEWDEELSGWEFLNVNASSTTSETTTGTYSAQLDVPVSDYGPQSCLSKAFTIPLNTFSGGLTYEAVVYVWWSPALTPDTSGRIVEVRRYVDEAHWLTGDPVDQGDIQSIDLDGTTGSFTGVASGGSISAPDPFGWRRVVVPCWVPPNNTGVLEVRLYAPFSVGSLVYGNGIAVTRGDTFATPELGEDAARTFARLVFEAQNTAKGKSDLGLGTSCPLGYAANVVVSEPEDQHQTFKAIADKDLFNVNGGVDVDVFEVPGHTTFVTGTQPDPGGSVGGRIGRQRLDLPLLPDRFWRDIAISRKGSECANSVIVKGSDSGWSGEEAAASDTDGLDGVTVEEVYQAPTGALFYTLQDTAIRRLGIRGIPPWSVTAKLTADWWFLLGNGDLIPSGTQIGAVKLPDELRVIRKTLSPKAGYMEVELAYLDFGRDLTSLASDALTRIATLERRPAAFLNPPSTPSVPPPATLTWTASVPAHSSAAIHWSGNVPGVCAGDGPNLRLFKSGSYLSDLSTVLLASLAGAGVHPTFEGQGMVEERLYTLSGGVLVSAAAGACAQWVLNNTTGSAVSLSDTATFRYQPR